MNETFYFVADDSPSGIRNDECARLILQINGRFGSSQYKTVCYYETHKRAQDVADMLNRSVLLPCYADLIERILEQAKR